MGFTDWASLAANVATAVGLIVVAVQMIWQASLERKQFEDGFAREYRDLIHVLPVEAMLGKPLDGTRRDESMTAFYRYFDLCNQQAFMHEKGRIGSEVWRDWAEGIRDNLKLPAFQEMWAEIKKCRPDSFHELRRLEQNHFRP